MYAAKLSGEQMIGVTVWTLLLDFELCLNVEVQTLELNGMEVFLLVCDRLSESVLTSNIYIWHVV